MAKQNSKKGADAPAEGKSSADAPPQVDDGADAPAGAAHPSAGAPPVASAPPEGEPPPGDAPPLPTQPEPPAAARPPDPPTKPMLRVAFALKSCSLYLNGSLTHVLGGTFIDNQLEVEQVRSDPSFRLIPVPDRAAVALLKKGYAEEVARVERLAADLGLVVSRHGEGVTPAKRR